jgi:hypothetical protein
MANRGTREELIEVGLKQIHSAGYTATGINQILELADVPKGSFYHHFASKDAFAKEILEHYNFGEQERCGGGNGSISGLKSISFQRDRPFGHSHSFFVFSTFLARPSECHRSTVLRPELAGTHFSSATTSKQASDCPWCQRCWVWSC